MLERLDDYLSRRLSVDERRNVELHLAGCTQCAQFGGVYGRLVHELQCALYPELDKDICHRLDARLKTVLS